MTLLPTLRFPALAIAVIAAAGCVAALFLRIDLTLFFRAYLFSYLFCLGLALGSVCLLMLHNLTGGDWGIRIHPIAHAAAATLPLLALLFIPLCFGLHALYPWARPEEFAQSHILLHRRPYLNPTFFFIRAVFYFTIWIALAFLLNRPRPAARAISAIGLILYLLTMTHAGIDWIMSRDVEFYSTAFGFILTVGQTLSALALAVALLPWLPPTPARPHPRPTARLPVLNDLGSLVLTLVILWAYVSFMQLLVVWMGNTRDDNAWYLERGFGGGGDSAAWRTVAAILVLCHFFIPFYLMLFRGAKQKPAILSATAGCLLVAHILEQYWLVAPSGHDGAAIFDPHWLDLLALIALFATWFAAFLFLANRRSPELIAPPLSQQGVPAHD